MLHLGLDLARIVERLRDFALDDLAKTAAQPMNGHFGSPFIQPKLPRSIGLGQIFGIAREPRLERFKMARFAGSFLLLLECREGAVENRHRPFAIELTIRAGCIWIGHLQCRGSIAPGFEWFDNLTAASF